MRVRQDPTILRKAERGGLCERDSTGSIRVLGVLQSSRSTPEPDTIEPGYSESALAEELARIMKRKPVRAAREQAEEARSPTAANAAVGEVIELSERAQDGGTRSAAEHDSPLSATVALPAWATGRKRRAGAHRVRMVGASLLAVTVVLAIIGGAAIAMFGNRADVAALSRDVLGKLTWAPWSSPATVKGSDNGEVARGMAAAKQQAVP